MLGLVRPLAALGVLALVTGRSLAPALRGAGVGLGRLVAAVDFVGALSSQMFAAAAMMMAIFAIMAVSRSRLPLSLRFASLALGGFAVLPTIWAVHEPVPEISASLIAASASLLGLVAFPVSLRAPFARPAGAVVGLVALGGLVRVAGVAVVLVMRHSKSAPAAALGIGGDLGFACDALAITVALVWNASQAKALASPGTLVALAAAALVTRLALSGQSPEAGTVELVCWRAALRLLSTPDASVSLTLRLFVAILAPSAAIVTLLRRGPVPALSAAVALALAARGALEMAPCALMVIVAALTTALAAHDGRALWAALESRPLAERPSGG